MTWTILSDEEQITEDCMDAGLMSKSPFKVDIPWNPDRSKNDYSKIFFDYFFPCLKGKAKVLDEYHADVRSSAHNYVAHDNIKFHREDADDPDELVSFLCFHSSCHTNLKHVTYR